jgi:serine kinase of HPr protein (carbohydrate metabolism regulator)
MTSEFWIPAFAGMSGEGLDDDMRNVIERLGSGLSSTIHASAVLTGATAVLIRGPSGAGKSRLALALIEAARCGTLSFARLVADDRTALDVASGRLLARPPAALAGLIEVRGLGVRRLPHEPVATVGLVVDLASPDAARLPDATVNMTEILGLPLPRIPVAAGIDALPVVMAALHTRGGPD